jgi:aminopeptidase N
MSTGFERHLLADYRPLDYQLTSLDMWFVLDAVQTHVCTAFHVVTLTDAPVVMVLNGEALTLISVRLNDRLLSASDYALGSDTLSLSLPSGESKLEIVTHISPIHNTQLQGLYVSDGVFCTQCEAEGFRRITYFPDRPDAMTRYRVYIEAAKSVAPVLLSNGNCVEKGDLADDRHYAIWEDPYAKPSYLFALVAGDLTCQSRPYVTADGRDVSLEVYVKAHHAHRCNHALTSLASAMRWDEETFGLNYDLDRYMIVAVDDFNMGAMENKGLNVFNARFVLADPDTATDVDYANVDSVIAHEYFHNWTGNRVTCRNWFQLTLKEGLTVFRDQSYTEDTLLGAVKRIDDVRTLRSVQFNEDAGPMRHPIMPDAYVEMNNFYTATVYEKGAEVVRVYQTLLGKAGFRKGMDTYFARHDGDAVTVHEFRHAMADANGYDLSQMHAWYTQAGTPVVLLSWQWDGVSKVTIQCAQHIPHVEGFQPLLIPIAVAVFNAQGERQSATLVQGDGRWQESDGVLWLRQAQEVFVLQGVSQAPVFSWLRGFSAPIILTLSRSLSDWLWQAHFDDDLFNRWEACQQAWVSVLKSGVLSLRDGLAYTPPEEMFALVEQLLANTQLPRAWLVEALRLPSFDYLAQQLDTLWVDEWLAVLNTTKQCLGVRLHDAWWQQIDRCDSSSSYRFDADEMSRRALRNLALSYLCESQDEKAWTLAAAQVAASHNMTDVQAALTMLVHTGAPQASAALAAFYDRWHTVPLVLDKWFSIQASSPKASAQEIDALSHHVSFVWTNPNRVRSVYGVMGRANPAAFHQADGAGYSCLAQRVSEMDAFNPQLASRVLQAFSVWRKCPSSLQSLAGDALSSLVSLERLSKDVREVLLHLRSSE